MVNSFAECVSDHPTSDCSLGSRELQRTDRDMAIIVRHCIFGVLALLFAVAATSCSSDGAGQTLSVNFDESGSKKAELVQPDQVARVTSINAKTTSFAVMATVTYKGTRALEYIWNIDHSDSAVESSITADPVNPNRATITLTYSSPLSVTAFDGSLPIRLTVKEIGGSISDSEVMYVDVSIFGGTNG